MMARGECTLEMVRVVCMMPSGRVVAWWHGASWVELGVPRGVIGGCTVVWWCADLTLVTSGTCNPSTTSNRIHNPSCSGCAASTHATFLEVNSHRPCSWQSTAIARSIRLQSSKAALNSSVRHKTYSARPLTCRDACVGVRGRA